MASSCAVMAGLPSAPEQTDANPDQADPDAGTIVDILDSIPGAWERHRQGSEDARAGRTKSLEDL